MTVTVEVAIPLAITEGGEATTVEVVADTAPGPVGEKKPLVAEGNGPDVGVAVSEYCVPTTPAKAQFATLMTPATADKPEHDEVNVGGAPSVPPDAVSVIPIVDVVTTLPPASSTEITGSVATTDSEFPSMGCVVKTN